MSNLIAISLSIFTDSFCKKILYSLVAILFIVFGVVDVYAQKLSYDNYIIRNFRHGDGLIDAQINTFLKDKDGFVWLGTPSSIQRFDGVKSVLYTFDGSTACVNVIYQCSNGELLAGTDKGLYIINHKNRKIIPVNSDIKSSVNDIEEHGEYLFIASSDGLYRIASDKKADRVDGVEKDYISLSGGIDMYLMASDGLSLYEGGSLKKLGNGNIKSRFTCMSDRGKSLLIGTEDMGLYSFDKRTKCFSHYLNVGNNRITSIDSNSDNLIIGTDGSGIFVVSESEPGKMFNLDFRPDNDGSHLAFDKVKSVLMDDLDIIWISYSRNVGFDYIQFQNKPFNLFSCRNKLPVDIDYSKVYVCDSLKLFSSFNGVYSIDSSSNVAYHRFSNVSRSGDKNVTCFYPFGQHILVGTSNGMFCYTDGTDVLEHLDGYPKLDNVGINYMTSDENDNLLIATDSGLFILNGADGGIVNYSMSNSNIASDHVMYLFVDRSGTKWVASSSGLQIFDEEKGRFDDAGSKFNDLVPVTFLTEDNKDRLIVISNKQEAYLFVTDAKDRRRICTSEDAGFLGLYLEKILQDKNDNYWFIGSRGAVKGNPLLTEYTLFSSTEGLIEPYSNDGQIFNDTLWIATPMGVLFTYINAPIHSAPTRITDVVINGESRIGEYADAINSGNDIDLSGTDSNITFSFATLSYDMPNRMIYEYKLEGHDDNWIIMRGNNTVSYNNLAPGRYRFIVRKQMDNSSMQYVSFTIPYGYTWIIISGVIAVALVVGSLIAYRRMSERKKRESVHDENEIRVKETDKYKFNKLKDDTADTISQRLNEYMAGERPYLNPDLKLINVADRLNVTPQVLSQVLNTRLNTRFNDYINQFRIETFKEYVSSSGMSKYTLQTLASKCGFSSYSTFFRAFKDITGQTPNEYIKGNSVHLDASV